MDHNPTTPSATIKRSEAIIRKYNYDARLSPEDHVWGLHDCTLAANDDGMLILKYHSSNGVCDVAAVARNEDDVAQENGGKRTGFDKNAANEEVPSVNIGEGRIHTLAFSKDTLFIGSKVQFFNLISNASILTWVIGWPLLRPRFALLHDFPFNHDTTRICDRESYSFADIRGYFNFY